MSTEHQRYSPIHQQTAIAAYAATHGIEIVRTYADEGISGVSMRHRRGLQTLLADVLGGQTDFDTVLVFDVSRWGRFQNPDQSAHYEFLCAEAGVRVEYCAELFENDGSLSSTLLKSLKRAMAAEYSRDLSAKVRGAQRRLAELGFWQGGVAPYGLRRRIVLPEGGRGQILETRERKAIQSQRIILVPGPRREVIYVNRIFRLYAFGGIGVTRIARMLNSEGWSGTPWTDSTVHSILTNPAYVGDLVYGKKTGLLGAPQVLRAKAEWTVVRGAFEGIVPRRVFDTVQAIRAGRHPKPSFDDVLAVLRRIHAEHGLVNFKLIREAAVPGVEYFVRRHGGLRQACDAIGVRLIDHPKLYRRPMDDATAIARLAALYARHGYLSSGLIRQDPTTPSATTYRKRWGSLRHAFDLVGYCPRPKARPPLEGDGMATLSTADWRTKRRRRAPEAGLETGRGEGEAVGASAGPLGGRRLDPR